MLRGDAFLLQGELGEAVPVAFDLLRERFLVGAVQPGRLGGLGVAGALGDALEQLVAGDLEVLGGVAVAGVTPGLLLPDHVDDALHQRAHHAGRLAHHRGRRTAGLEPLPHAVGVLLGLELVLAEIGLDLLVVGRLDHPVEHAQDVLLHRERLVDVLGQLRVQIRHRTASSVGNAFQCESPEHLPAKRCAAPEAIGLWLEHVDEPGERRAVAKLEPDDVETRARERADRRLPARSVDAPAHARQRRQQSAGPPSFPVPAGLGLGGTVAPPVPPQTPPFPPMEAELVEELPTGDWQYEPKWDGFRGVLENLGGGLRLWSRNGRPLLRYFPELEAVGALLPAESALDGEIIISREGRLEFDQLQLRLHPAESRIKRLSAEIPADYVAFDLLVWKGKPIHELPLEKRRRELERKAAKFRLSPATRERKQAERWLERLRAARARGGGGEGV